jgi:AraC family transcriptional regulator of arabinose operon
MILKSCSPYIPLRSLSKTFTILLSMIKDRVAIDLPYYDGLLAGHHCKEPGYALKRQGGTDDWLLVATLSGAGRFGSSLGDLIASPTTLTLLAPGTTHDYGTERNQSGWEILWVHFHPPHEWLELLHWPQSAPGIACFDSPESAWPEIQECFWEVCRLCFWPGNRRKQRAMNCLERLLLLCESHVPDTGVVMDDRIQRAIEYMHSHLRDPLSLETLSAIVHLSPSRFAHLFRAETGMPPLQYMSLQRIQRASILLERTTLSVSQIAGEVGMEPFHFSSRFKSQTGRNPRDYRASHLGRPV